MNEATRTFCGVFAGTLLLGLASSTSAQRYGAEVGFGDSSLYEVGGAVPIRSFGGFSGRPAEVGVEFGWAGDFQCGNFDISTSIGEQLSDAESATRQMMDNVISSAQGTVASLPGLALQRLNPSLYDMLTGMMAEAGVNFRLARANCERTVQAMRDRTAVGGWRSLADGQFWKEQIGATGEEATDVDARVGAGAGGDAGVSWGPNGEKAGGVGQEPIRQLQDSVAQGLATVTGATPPLPGGASADYCTGDAAEFRVCQVFPTLADARDFQRKVVGEVAIQTCREDAGCTPVTAQPGEGLREAMRDEIDALYGTEDTGAGPLLRIANGAAINAATLADLRGAGGVGVDPFVLHAIQGDASPSRRRALAGRLAAEIAMERTLERAFLLRRSLRAGLRAPNVAANELAQETVREAIAELNEEIAEMQQEMLFAERRARGVPVAMLGRARVRTGAPVAEFDMADHLPTAGAVGADAEAERAAREE